MYKCKEHGYCLTGICPTCKGKADIVKVQDYGPEDKFGEHRRNTKWKAAGK
ncbi:ribosome biogenesis protein [Candidatus Woesearchaeota archaeon]|nr:ribosome biogenesis protein [Candidatus Woesearchaeota archaeon]